MGMKVLYLLPSPFPVSSTAGIGGHLAHIAGVVQALARQGAQVDVVAGEELPMLQGQGIRQHILGCRGQGVPARLMWNLRLLRELRRLSRSNTYDFMYMRYAVMFSVCIPLMRLMLGGLPLVLEVNSFGATSFRILGIVESRAVGSADLVVTVSSILRSQLLKYLPGVREDRVLILPNGVEPGRFQVEPRMVPGEPGAIKVGLCGIFKPGYNIELLMDAFLGDAPETAGLELHLVGGGDLEPELRARAAGAGNIVFHGPRPFAEVPSWLAAMDILAYVQSPKLSFGSPTKLFEYMAAGKPIVAVNHPQARELLGDGRRGLLVPYDDVSALRRALRSLADDPARRVELGRLARAEVEAKHTWDQRVAELLHRLGPPSA